ncbi:MAG TPA: tetratricopeptide repeat protein [Chloroflexia bacterium]|nr:tetratricopeptide repeat protein [Chloroflexia bacterium]
MPQHNLPSQQTSFIGRERDIADISRSLQAAPLLTLTGAGGSGKTRLSIEVASRSLDDYPDGVWFVELDAITDPALVAPIVASTMGLREETGRSIIATLEEALGNRKVLLILDNCEHLVRACASLAGTLLRSCPGLHVLATSRHVLNIVGEIIWRVPSLSFPDPHHLQPLDDLGRYEAIQLFIERARLKQPAFDLAPDNAHSVAQLCYEMDGLPLALELAAARVDTMPVQEIAARLDERFRLLVGDNRTIPNRQQTLQAAIDWSYDLLSEIERQLLRSVSVFAGSFSLDAVEGICIDGAAYEAMDLLPELVDRSLVLVEGRTGETRFRLLDTIRQYALRKLRADTEEGAVLRTRHLLWYTLLGEKAQPHLQGPEQAAWLESLQVEYDNIRAALEWGLNAEGDLENVSRLAVALGWFWYVRGYATEGRRWLEVAIKSGTLPPDLLALALYRAGLLARSQGDYGQATSLFTRCLEIFRATGDQKYISATLLSMGVVATNMGDYEQATILLKESLALKQEIGDRSGGAIALNNLANIATDQGDFVQARRYFEECVAIQGEEGNRFMLAVSLNNLGNIARCLGEYDKARELVNESLSIKRELGDKIETASSLHKLAEIEWCERNYEEARRLCKEGLATLQDTGDKEATALILNTLGEIARCQGDYAEARAHYEEALATAKERWVINDALCNLGRAAAQEGDYIQAEATLKKCLDAYLRVGAKKGIAECLAAAGKMGAAQGFLELAARLFGTADALLTATGYHMHPDDEKALKQSHIAVRSRIGKAAWVAVRDEGRSMSLDVAVASAIELMEMTLQAIAEATSKKTAPRSPKYPNDLTQREVEVLRLVAEGLTDAGIAERLSLSSHTIHAHLRSIYAKLGVTTRSAAGRFAIDIGLV